MSMEQIIGRRVAAGGITPRLGRHMRNRDRPRSTPRFSAAAQSSMRHDAS